MSYLVTFHSVSDALMAKKLLDASGGKGTVIPAPRTLSTSCGYALEVESSSNMALKEALEKLNGDYSEIYSAERYGRNVVYTEISGIENL